MFGRGHIPGMGGCGGKGKITEAERATSAAFQRSSEAKMGGWRTAVKRRSQRPCLFPARGPAGLWIWLRLWSKREVLRLLPVAFAYEKERPVQRGDDEGLLSSRSAFLSLFLRLRRRRVCKASLGLVGWHPNV
ncbi:hypothetical protein MRX96_036882 [Rhipicephalus microplus]